MEIKYRRHKGTRDIMLTEVERWRWAEARWAEVLTRFGYGEIRTPVMEPTSLFLRSVGEGTDIVDKEMYTFETKGGDSLTLRPVLDAEVIQTAMALFETVGATGLTAKINSIGCPECRPGYLEDLKMFLKGSLADIPESMQGRIDINPLRLYDAKDDGVQALLRGFKPITDALCDSCREHHRVVTETLVSLGVAIEQDPALVRGLDYYCRTTFEITATSGGGRYDYLVEQCGGPPTPAVGFSIGIERTLLYLDDAPVDLQRSPQSPVDVYVACRGMAAQQAGFMAAHALRSFCRVEVDTTDRSLKAQAKSAHLRKARVMLTVGADELATETMMMRNLETGQQEPVARDGIPAAVREVLEG